MSNETTIQTNSLQKKWSVYLSGEIHTNWRDQISLGIQKNHLPVITMSPVTDHASSDDCGVHILGPEKLDFWKDSKGARLNSIRNKTLINHADIVIVKFGEKYRQWNAAFDAGYSIAMNKPLITIHPPEFSHALKEIDAASLAVTDTPEKVIDILLYVTSGRLR